MKVIKLHSEDGENYLVTISKSIVADSVDLRIYKMIAQIQTTDLNDIGEFIQK